MSRHLLLIFLMAGSNTLLKVLPVRLLGGRELPPFFVTWLRYVPVPVIAAMLASELLFTGGAFDVSGKNLLLWASLPAFAAGYFTKSLSVTVTVGIATLATARYLLP